MKERKFITIKELADMLGISRIAVYKKVKKGQIKAIRIGKTFAIPQKYAAQIFKRILTDSDKKSLDKAIKRTVDEYGEVLKLLGNA